MATLSRRTLVPLSAVVVLAAGCDPFSTAPAPAPGPTKDEVLVEQLVAAVRRVRDQAFTAGSTALVTMHNAHLAVLGAPSTPATSTLDAPTLRASEESLKVRLAAGAEAAGAGSLARVLASMAAAIAQQLVVLA